MRRLTVTFFATILLILIIQACAVHSPQPKLSIDLPRLENFSLDGSPAEWSKIEAYRLWADPLGQYSDPEDFEACMKVGWTAKSLHFLFEITDDSISSDTINPWNGDAIEIFLAPFRGSAEIHQVSIVTLPGKDFIRLSGFDAGDHSGLFSGEVHAVTQFQGNKRITEVIIGIREDNHDKFLKINSQSSLALQAYADDADSKPQNKLVWYPLGQSYNSSSSMFTVNLSDAMPTRLKGSSRVTITDNHKMNLFVFGGIKGDKIDLFRNGIFVKEYRSSSATSHLPDTFDISSLDWDIENDTLFVTLNGESLFLHELFLAPRLYEYTEGKRFDREIRNFVYMDRQASPPKNATLFIGSSSIVRWETLRSDFPELQIIHRGFGGSTSPEALMYMDRIALPYKPSQIIYYEGDNDIPMGITPEEVQANVRYFIEKVMEELPETKVYILSPKPSIHRMHLWEKYKQTHQLLKELAESHENAVFVDVATPMFSKDGKLRHSLFVEDGIHMTPEGYAIWTEVLRKALSL